MAGVCRRKSPASLALAGSVAEAAGSISRLFSLVPRWALVAAPCQVLCLALALRPCRARLRGGGGLVCLAGESGRWRPLLVCCWCLRDARGGPPFVLSLLVVAGAPWRLRCRGTYNWLVPTRYPPRG